MPKSDQGQKFPTWMQIRKQSRQILFDCTRKNPLFLCIAIAISAVSSLLHPIAVILCGQIFKNLTSYSSGLILSPEISHNISTLCFSLILLCCIAWIIEFGFMSSWIVHGERIAKEIRERTFTSLLNQEICFNYLRKLESVPLLIRLDTQIRELQLSASQPSGFIAYELFSLISSIGVALYHAWQLALLFLLIFLLMAFSFWFVSRFLESINREQEAYLIKASKSACTSIREIKTIKIHNAEEYELWQYKKKLKILAKRHITQAKINALQIAMSKFVVALYFIGGFWLGLYLTTHGKNPGDIIIAFYTTLAVMQSIEIVSSQWKFVAKGIAASNAVSSLLHESQTSKEYRDSSFLPNLESSNIELRGVSFSYPGNSDRYTLINTNFFFPAGKITYIVGKSGSGKSTIGMLISGIYNATKGEILIDGNSLEKIPLKWLYENITLVDQELLLFNESIYQNIAFGRLDSVCREDVINAGKIANLEKMLINLPNGLDNLVTKCGNSLSGGQRQRVVMSRARLRDSPILILDEATSALDQTSRKQLNNQILSWRAQKTTIIITHDLSQIRDEFIYVMDKGQVVQKGRLKKLAEEKNGIFASLLQTSKQNVNEHKFKAQEELLNFTGYSSAVANSHQASNIESNKIRPDKSCESTQILFNNSSRDTLSDTVLPKKNHSRNVSVESSLYESSPELKPKSFKQSINFPNKFSKWWRKFQKIKINSYLPKYEYEMLDRNIPAVIKKSQEYLPSSNYTDGQNDFLDKPHSHPDKFGLESYTITQILRVVLKSVWPTLSRKNKLQLALGVLSSFITASVIPIFAFFISNLMNIYKSTGNQQKEGAKWITALCMLVIIDFFSTYSSYYYLERVGQVWVNELRVKCLQNILAQPQEWIDDKRHSTSLLVQSLDRNAEEMRNLISRFFCPIFTTLWLLIISILWSLSIDWRLTIVALSCVPIICTGGVVFNWVTSKYEEKCNSMAENTSTIFVEAMMNIRMIRGFSLESFFEKKYKYSLALAYITGLDRSIYTGITYGFVSDAISFMTTALVVYYGTSLIIKDLLPLLSFYQIINLIFFGLGHSLATISLIPQVNSCKIAAAKISFLANLPYKPDFELKGTQSLVPLFPVVLRDLNFTYPRSASKVLSKINLTIKKSSFIVITGPSGSGKSTIATLLLGIYAPDESLMPSLSFAGIPIDKCHVASLRSSMAFVPQNPVLFPDTIYANIAYGHPPENYFANIKAVKQAAQDAGIAEFIDSLEKGFNTLIGEGGIGISRGQAQRIMIARAFFRCPAFLIMDEPTSALDTLSASHIRATIKKMRMRHNFSSSFPAPTLVIISHCVEMMALSDYIVVLDQGKIVECGNYQELRNKKNGLLKEITTEEV